MPWIAFTVIVAALFLWDLFSKESHSIPWAAFRTGAYVFVALSFGAFIWSERGPDDGVKFVTGYLLEMSLSLDNVFVMSLIFTALAIPPLLRHRVLVWGILGAIVLRGVFIGAGTYLAGQFGWVLVACAVFLIYSGVKSFMPGDEAVVDLEKNRAFKILFRFVPITAFQTDTFFMKVGARRWAATPMFVALVLVEIADLVFAADSVPAILGVTTDPLLVYTSNIFAIIGLRSLYRVLEAVVQQFEHVGKAVAIVLVFIGVKILLAQVLDVHLSNLLSLGVVASLIAGGIVVSLIARTPHGGKP